MAGLAWSQSIYLDLSGTRLHRLREPASCTPRWRVWEILLDVHAARPGRRQPSPALDQDEYSAGKVGSRPQDNSQPARHVPRDI